MTDTQTVVRSFAREDDADEARAILELFFVHARVEGPFPVDGWGDDPDGLEWKVVAEIPSRHAITGLAAGPMVDRDEATDYVDSHWDREAEDRDYWSNRRSWHD